MMAFFHQFSSLTSVALFASAPVLPDTFCPPDAIAAATSAKPTAQLAIVLNMRLAASIAVTSFYFFYMLGIHPALLRLPRLCRRSVFHPVEIDPELRILGRAVDVDGNLHARSIFLEQTVGRLQQHTL